MRRKEPAHDKNWCPGALTIPGVAASLDRIYKKVNAEGFAEDNASELEEDIRRVRERFAIGDRAAVLLAAILENNPRNGCDDDDLSNYIGCSNIEFLGFREPLRQLEDLGIVIHRSNRGNRYVMCREAVRSIEKDTEFQPLKRTGLIAEELFSRIRLVFSEYLRDNIDAERLLEDLDQLVDEKPAPETRAKIWKSMLDDLSDADALTLATRYDFSGGNIENIARKAAVGYVLSGHKACLGELVTYCDEETLSSRKTARRIGFQV